MNKYVYTGLLIFILCLAGCSLPANKDSADLLKKKAETVAKQQETEQPKKQSVNTAGQITKEAEPVKKESPVVKTKEKKIRITLYYQDSDGILIPVTRGFKSQEGIAKTAITALIDNSIAREEIEFFGIYPVLPLGTEILGLNIKQGTATIDFNEKLLNYKDNISERNIISSIVYTLTEFEAVKNVKILVKGRIKKDLRFGTDISKPLNRQNVLINSEKTNIQEKNMKVDVYLFKNVSKNAFIVPVSVECSDLTEETIPSRIIDLSGKKYFDEKLKSQLPEGTKLLNSSLNRPILTLNFSKEFKNYGGNAREDAIIKQLQYSMKQLNGIKKIKILIENKTEPLPEGTETQDGLEIPSEINYIDED